MTHTAIRPAKQASGELPNHPILSALIERIEHEDRHENWRKRRKPWIYADEVVEELDRLAQYRFRAAPNCPTIRKARNSP